MDWKIAIFTPGDHIRVKRDHYYHHGIFVGNGEVIHYTSEKDDGINKADEVFVRKTSIEFFLKDGVGEKALYTRKEKRRLNKPEEIVRLANEFLGRGNYNIISNNCETFANDVSFKKDEKIRRNPHILRFIVRFFFKFTGLFAYALYLKPRHYYTNRQAKKENRSIKGGAILISNHTAIKDYYLHLYNHPFRVIHTLAAEIVYKSKFLTFLCWAFENIRVNREDVTSVKAYAEAKKYLNRNKSILVFPEGHIEDNKGELDEFKPSVIMLAFETGKPIIPSYIKGNYGLFKRVSYITGNRINVRELVGKDTLEPEDIKRVQTILFNEVKRLKHQLGAIETNKTHKIFTKNLILLDFARFSSIPFGYCLLRGRKIYVGNKKEIKKAMKEKVILTPNHTSMFDVVYLYLYFMSRRVRVVALADLWNLKIFGKLLSSSGTIKYNRNSAGGFDIRCFKEVCGILEGNGCVALFPQGKIVKGGEITETIKGGAAIFSLRNNAPIIPIIFPDETGFKHATKMVVGDVIRPTDYFSKDDMVSNANVDKYNDIIYKKMLDLQEKSRKYSRNARKEKSKCPQKLD